MKPGLATATTGKATAPKAWAAATVGKLLTMAVAPQQPAQRLQESALETTLATASAPGSALASSAAGPA